MHLTVLLVATRFLGLNVVNVVNVVNVNVSHILDVAGTMEVHLHGEDPPKVRIKAPLEPKGEVTMAKVRTLRGQERPVHRKAAQKGKVSGNKSESNLSEKKTHCASIYPLGVAPFLGESGVPQRLKDMKHVGVRNEIGTDSGIFDQKIRKVL